jgi:hypothetical protein
LQKWEDRGNDKRECYTKRRNTQENIFAGYLLSLPLFHMPKWTKFLLLRSNASDWLDPAPSEQLPSTSTSPTRFNDQINKPPNKTKDPLTLESTPKIKPPQMIRSLAAAAVALLLVSSSSAADSVCDCPELCSLLPPEGSVFPCYQGEPGHASTCFKTDPLLPEGSTWSCQSCADHGYPEYLRKDPIYRHMELWGKGKDAEQVGGAGPSKPCAGCGETCALVPPAGSAFPCYEGAPEDAAVCYVTDPLLATGTTWKCSTCMAEGFPVYLRQDPIYPNMGLWTREAKGMHAGLN